MLSIPLVAKQTPLFDPWPAHVRPWRELSALLARSDADARVGLDILRHGETTANARGLVSGASDVPLSDAGREEARLAGRLLVGHYDVAFHSPLARSRETLALALAESAAAVDRVVEEPRVAERSMGDLEGAAVRPLAAYDAGDLRWAPCGGEPYIEVVRRCLSFLVDLHERAVAARQPPRVVVCTHAGPMRVLVAALTAAADPRRVLTGRYDNARIASYAFSRLSWPPFVQLERSELG